MNDLEPLRFSRLKLLAKSPMHYQHGFDGESASLRKGSATHSFLIGDASRVRIYDGRRDKRSKDYQEFLETNPNCEIMIESEMKDVQGMRRAIERHPQAMQLLDGTVREERLEWECMGRNCAGTPDVVHIDKKTGKKGLVELKTTKSADPFKFKWQAHSLLYHAQMAWYSKGIETTMVYQPGPVVWHKIVAVESSAPYPVTIINVTRPKIRAGAQTCKELLEALLSCERTGQFPPYAEGEVDWEDEEQGDGLDWGTDDEEAA